MRKIFLFASFAAAMSETLSAAPRANQASEENFPWQMGEIVTEPRHAAFETLQTWQEFYTEGETQRFRDRYASDLDSEPVVTYAVQANNGTLRANIEKYLAGLPEIKKRAFRRKEKEITRRVAEAVSVYGYYNPTIDVSLVDPKDSDSGRVRVTVERGEPTLYSKIEISYGTDEEVEKKLKEIEKKYKIAEGEKFHHGRYENFKSDVMETAISMGYIRAKISKSGVKVYSDENSAELVFSLEPGVRYRYGKVSWEGFDESHELAKMMNPIVEGEYLSQEVTSKLSQNLYDSGYYQTVDVRIERQKSKTDELPVTVALAPKPFTIAEFGIGMSTDDGFRVQLSEKNPWLNSSGHSFNSQAKYSRIHRYLRGNYIIPRDNPLADYWKLSPSLEHKDHNDTLYDAGIFAVHYIDKDDGYWEKDYFLEYGYDDFVQAGTKGYSSLLMPGFMISHVESDNPIDPTHGYKIAATFKASVEETISTQSIAYADVIFKYLMTPMDDWRLLFKIRQSGVFGGDMKYIPPRLRFFTGGDQSIRGFGYEQIAPKASNGKFIGGRYLTVGTAEIQVPVAENLRLALFADAGTSTLRYGHDSKWEVGTGIGIRYITPVGPIRVDLAVGVTDHDVPIRIHFGLGADL